MRYFFGVISVINKHILKLFVCQITLLYSNFVNNLLILSKFLYCSIVAKLELLKNILIDILLICINLTSVYFMLFLNKRQLLFNSISISAIYAMIIFLFTVLPSSLLLPLLNLIHLNLF